MQPRTISTIFPAMLAIATVLAQTPAPTAPPDLDQLLKSARSAYLQGDYPAARTSLDQAWTAIQQLPRSEPRRYEIAKQLSTVLSAAGDYKTAQEYLQAAIDWREKDQLRGPLESRANPAETDDSKLTNDWIDMANLCQRQNDFERALALLEFVQSRHVRFNGRQSLPVADDFSRIALLHMEEKKPALAIAPLQQAIGIRETVLGAEHPAILTEVDRLAAVQISLRLYADAEETFRRALVIRERLTGRMHTDLIASVEGLAYAQFGQKKYDEAEQGYKRLLALWIFAAGTPDYPMIALTLDKIEVFYRTQKRWEEAEDAAGRAIAVRQMFLANSLKHEAAERLAHDDNPGAVKLLQRAVDALDESRPEHTELLGQLRAALTEMGVLDKAVKPVPDKPAAKSPKPTPTKATNPATTTKPQ
jgi:tetratricopeptide (TPR) repeat protein